MTQKKRRIPPSDDLSAEVLFASDSTCCICHQPGRPVQLHHIDEDPSNNAPDNLAVLCLDCHDKTQISGGFGRKYSPALVTKYRDEWFATVKQRRALEAGGVKSPAPRRTQPRMSQEQARQHAERLRALYTTLFKGVGYLHDIASHMSDPLLNETWEQREANLIAAQNQALQLIRSTQSDIFIEPGSAQVYEHFERFREYYGQFMSSSALDHTRPSLMRQFNMRLTMMQVSREVDEIRTAIQKHLAQVDKRS